jgi:hypothetical protein
VAALGEAVEPGTTIAVGIGGTSITVAAEGVARRT